MPHADNVLVTRAFESFANNLQTPMYYQLANALRTGPLEPLNCEHSLGESYLAVVHECNTVRKLSCGELSKQVLQAVFLVRDKAIASSQLSPDYMADMGRQLSGTWATDKPLTQRGNRWVRDIESEGNAKSAKVIYMGTPAGGAVGGYGSGQSSASVLGGGAGSIGGGGGDTTDNYCNGIEVNEFQFAGIHEPGYLAGYMRPPENVEDCSGASQQSVSATWSKR